MSRRNRVRALTEAVGSALGVIWRGLCGRPEDGAPRHVEAMEQRTMLSSVLYAENFDTVAEISGDWTSQSVSVSPDGRQFLGQFGDGRDAVSFTLRDLKPGATYTLDFELLVIRSWDGDDPLNGPDTWQLHIDGRETLAGQFDNMQAGVRAQWASDGRGSYRPVFLASGLWDTAGFTYQNLSAGAIYRIQQPFEASSSTATFTFSSKGLGVLKEESWGLDNVQVRAGLDLQPVLPTVDGSASVEIQTVVAPSLDADVASTSAIGPFAQPLHEVNTGIPRTPTLRVFRKVGGSTVEPTNLLRQSVGATDKVFELGFTIGDQSVLEGAYHVVVRPYGATGPAAEFTFGPSSANADHDLVKDELGRIWVSVPGLVEGARYTVTARALGSGQDSTTATTYVFPALLPAISFDAPAIDSAKSSVALAGGESQAMTTSQSTPPVFAIPHLESWPMDDYGDIIDPHLVTDLGTLRLIENVYSTLVQRGEPTGQQSFYDLMPELAEYWEVSQDLTVYTFDLREGVKFHDGVPLTATDVVFSLRRIQGLGVRDWQFPDGMTVEALDSTRVEITLSQDPLVPHAPLLSYLAHPLNAVISHAAFVLTSDPAQSVLLSNSGGSGEYLLSEVEPGESAVLTRNDNYFFDNSSLPEALVAQVFSTTGAVIAAFEAGEVDIIPDVEVYRMSQTDIGRLSAVQYAVVESVDVNGDEAPEGNRITFLLTNRQDENSPFADDRVRQAVSFLLDRQTFADDILDGLAVPAAGPIAPWHAYYDGQLTVPEYNKEQAEILLSEAGYPADENGDRLDLTLLVPVEPDAWSNPRVNWIVGQLGLVGITVTPSVVQRDVYWANLQAGDYNLALATWWGDQDPDSWTYGLLHSQGAWGFALSGDDTAETDGLLTAARPMTDEELRGEAYDEVQGLSASGPPLIYLTSDQHVTARKNVWWNGVDWEALNVPVALTGLRSSQGTIPVGQVDVPPLPDLDVDSDNNNNFDPPGRTAYEDLIEDSDGFTGKIIVPNYDDGDDDNIPDFADGFSLFPGNDYILPPTAEQGERFVPLVVEAPEYLDPYVTTVRFVYNASRPSEVVRTADPDLPGGYSYQAGPGQLRLWTKNGYQQRQQADFVDSGVSYLLSDFSDPRVFTLYIEGIVSDARLPDPRIVLEVDVDGPEGPLPYVEADAVRLTLEIKSDAVEPFEPQIGAARNQRVDIHGVPLPDPSPTGDGEADRIPNMAYIDAFSLTPSFSTTDVAVPMPGGELLLEFRRTLHIDSRITHPDADPEEQPFIDFEWPSANLLGPGWDTNIVSNIIVRYNPEPPEGEPEYRATVRDEVGNAVSYIGVVDAGEVVAYVPDVRSSFSNASLRGTLTPVGTTLVYRKAFGTTLTFEDFTGNAIDRDGDDEDDEFYYRLAQIQDRNGNALEFTYSASQPTVPSSIQDADTPGRQLQFDYSSEGGELRLATVTDPLGREYNYEYDNSLLSRVVKPQVEDPDTGLPASPHVDFTYQVTPAAPRIVLAGASTQWESATELIQWFLPSTITDARQEQVTSFTYVSELTPTTIKSMDGQIVPIYEQQWRLSQVTTTDGTAYFDNARPRTHTDVATVITDTRGVTTRYDFDGKFLPAVNDLGFALAITKFTRTTDMADPAEDLTATYEFSRDLHGNLMRVTDLSGNVVTFEYDSDDINDPYNDVKYAVGTYGVNTYGRYYQIFNQPSASTLAANDPNLSFTTQYRYDTIFNKLIQKTDAAGLVIDYGLDANGNRTLVTEAAGNLVVAAETEYVYNVRGFVTKVTDPDGRVTEYIPNAYGNLEYTVIRGIGAEDLTPLHSSSFFDDRDSEAEWLVTRRVADIMDNTQESYDGFGNKTTYEYDNWDRLIEVTPPDPEGEPDTEGTVSSTISYDFNSNVVKETDQLQNVTIHEYDAFNRRISTRRRMDDPATNSTDDIIQQWQYNAVGLLDYEIDPNGNGTDYEYDELLRLTRTILPTVTLPDESTTRYETQYFYGPNSGSGAFTFGGFNPTRVINARGYATDTAYDAAYRATQMVQRLDDGDGVAHDAAPRPTEPAVSTEYNAVHQPVKVKVWNEDRFGTAANRVNYTFYDTRHRPTISLLDFDGYGPGVAVGLVVDDPDSFNGDAYDFVTRTKYDLAGNGTNVEDAEGRITTMVIDGASRVKATILPPTTVDDPARNITRSMSLVTLNQYDPAGNLARVTRGVLEPDDPLDDLIVVAQTEMRYDARNRLTHTILDLDGDSLFELDQGDDVDDIVTAQGYDLAGNMTYVIDPRGNQTDTIYDRANRPTTVTGPAVYDVEHDEMAQPVTVTAYDFNSNIILITDPRDVITKTVYDELNRARFVIANFGDAGTANSLKTESQYDENGNVTALILHNYVGLDLQEQSTVYEYDPFDRQTSETLPDIGDNNVRQTVKVYSPAGDVLSITDAKGQRIENDYDLAGRVNETRFVQADDTVKEIRTSEYDNVGNLLTRSEEYRIDEYTSYTDTSTYDYDALNRVAAESRENTRPGIADNYVVVSAYDALGNRSKVTYPTTGRELISTYDRAGRMTEMDDQAVGQTSFQYDLAGNRTRADFPNGLQTTASFDALNRVLTMASTADQGQGDEIYSISYEYDLASNRRWATEASLELGTREIEWDYDNLYRLTSESWTGPEEQTRQYTYDSAGNRLSSTVTVPVPEEPPTVTETTNVYDDLNQLVSSETDLVTTTYTHDLNGNRASKTVSGQTTTYTWDVSNRLVSAADGGGTIFTAAYDARTRRLAKTEGGATTLFRYDGGTSFQELKYTGSEYEVTAELIRAGGLGGGIGSILYNDQSMAPTSGPVEHFVYNAVGHTVALTDEAGAVTQASLYEAFGQTVAQTGGSGNNRLANTKERDGSIGLDNHGFRYYDPSAGRYISRDPIGYGDGMNVYASVHNNPINGVDPVGLAARVNPLGWPGKLIAVAGKIAEKTKVPVVKQAGRTVRSLGNTIESPATIAEGVVTLKGRTINDGLDQGAKGILGVLGLNHLGKDTRDGVTSGYAIPKWYADIIKQTRDDKNARWSARMLADDDARGNKRFHAWTMAREVDSASLFEIPWIVIIGVGHEIADPKSMSAEKSAQGAVGAAIDGITDVVANTLGQIGGLFLPSETHEVYSKFVGGLIPSSGYEKDAAGREVVKGSDSVPELRGPSTVPASE